MRARISICHQQIRSTNYIIAENRKKLAACISNDSYSRLSQFLKLRARSVQNNITARHEKKLKNLNNECTPDLTSLQNKWVINLSSKSLSRDEQAILAKGPKYAPTPSQIPHKNIVAEIEAAIIDLPDESKDSIRTSAANLLRRCQLPSHKNTTANERKAIDELRKDKTRIVMKADKGNCFVVMDRSDYDEKMQELLDDQQTYEKVTKTPFKKIERDLNAHLLQLKHEQKLDQNTYKKLHSTDAIPPAIRGSVKHHKPNNPLRPIVTCRNTALYNTSKFLSNILSPLQNHNGYSVNNSIDFAKKLTETHIDDDEIMVSFDVVAYHFLQQFQLTKHVNTYATNSRKTKHYITEPNYQLTTSSNFYASLLLIVILITTRKPTNKSTVVLWEVLLAILWQTSVWRKLRTQHLKNLTCHLRNGFAMSMMSFLSLRNMR